MRRRWSISAGTIRDSLLLLGGIAGVGYETVAVQVDRPWLLGVFVAMMGLPSTFRVGRPPDPPLPPGSPGGDSPSDTSPSPPS